jgi:hypothetical protein
MNRAALHGAPRGGVPVYGTQDARSSRAPAAAAAPSPAPVRVKKAAVKIVGRAGPVAHPPTPAVVPKAPMAHVPQPKPVEKYVVSAHLQEASLGSAMAQLQFFFELSAAPPC